MKIIFSFDDGRSDAYQAFKLLKKYALTASFHITTGFVDKSFITNSFGIERKPLTIDELIEMHKNGMDISSHGDKHITDNKDFTISMNKLKEWGINKGKYGFSVPNSNYTPELLTTFVNDNSNNLQYIRIGRSKECYTLTSKIHYVLYKLFKLQLSYNHFNKHNLITNINKHHIPSLVIKNYTKVKNIIKFINKYRSTNYTLAIMLHSIVDNPSNQWEWSTSNFTTLCEYLSKEKSTIEVLTLEELTKDL